jgi:hypothetical protein
VLEPEGGLTARAEWPSVAMNHIVPNTKDKYQEAGIGSERGENCHAGKQGRAGEGERHPIAKRRYSAGSSAAAMPGPFK